MWDVRIVRADFFSHAFLRLFLRSSIAIFCVTSAKIYAYSYGDYLTLEEVYTLTQPAEESLEAVTSWLTSNNISHTVAHGRRVHATIPLDAAEGLLNTKFAVLSNDANDVSLVRAGAYTLPPEVDAATAALFGLHGLPLPPKVRLASTQVSSGCCSI